MKNNQLDTNEKTVQKSWQLLIRIRTPKPYFQQGSQNGFKISIFMIILLDQYKERQGTEPTGAPSSTRSEAVTRTATPAQRPWAGRSGAAHAGLSRRRRGRPAWPPGPTASSAAPSERPPSGPGSMGTDTLVVRPQWLRGSHVTAQFLSMHTAHRCSVRVQRGGETEFPGNKARVRHQQPPAPHGRPSCSRVAALPEQMPAGRRGQAARPQELSQ